MTTARLDSLLARLHPVVREEMLKVAVPNCCIATVAVLCRVFRHFGFKARAIPCSVVIRNPKFQKCRDAGMVIPSDTEPLREWMDATGSWCIGIVPESALESAARGYEGFGGHVVCHVQDVLVDASLCQANRPHKQIDLPPLIAFDAFPEFLRGTVATVGIVAGCEVEYRPLKDQSWRQAPDWTDERRYREAVNSIIDRARGVSHAVPPHDHAPGRAG
jgi:hypothetical protein